jgi:hypothetical protein
MENVFLLLYFLVPFIGICAVMAFIESKLAKRKLPGFPAGYFTGERK